MRADDKALASRPLTHDGREAALNEPLRRAAEHHLEFDIDAVRRHQSGAHIRQGQSGSCGDVRAIRHAACSADLIKLADDMSSTGSSRLAQVSSMARAPGPGSAPSRERRQAIGSVVGLARSKYAFSEGESDEP